VDTEQADLAPKVKRALTWSTINNLLLRVGNFGVGILLARLLAPEQFGVYAVALTVQTVVQAFSELGLSSDLIRNGRIKERAGTTTTLATGSNALLAATMIIFAGPIASLLGSHQATPVVQVMSLTLVLAGLSVVPYAWIQREFRQTAQLVFDGSSLVVSTVLTVVLVKLGFGAMALAISRVVAQALVCVMQYAYTRMRLRFGYNREIARSLLKFGLPLASANLLSWIVLNVDYMVVGARGGAVMLGFYVLAFNISSWPMTALGQAVRSVALPGFSRLGDPRRKAEGFTAAAALTWAVALLAGVLLSTLATTVVPLLYGAKWSMAAQALAGLGFFGALRVVFDLTATFLIAVGATRSVLAVQAIWVVVLAPAMILGIDHYGLAGAGWSHVVVSVVCVLPAYLVLLPRHGVRLGRLLLDLLVPAVVAVPAIVVGTLIADAISVPILALAAGGAASSAVYLAPLLLWLRTRVRILKNSSTAPVSEETVVAAVSGV
jgi:PST family polysaccharide transporter